MDRQPVMFPALNTMIQGSSLRAACLHGCMQSHENGSWSYFVAVHEKPMLTHCFEAMQSSTPYASVVNSSKKGAGVW